MMKSKEERSEKRVRKRDREKEQLLYTHMLRRRQKPPLLVFLFIEECGEKKASGWKEADGDR